MTIPHLLALSADALPDLDLAVQRLVDHLRTDPELPLASIALTLQRRLRPLSFRRCVVACSTAEAIEALSKPVSSRARAPALPGRSVAFLFSGLGETQFGGVAALHKNLPAFRAAFDACEQRLSPECGAHLRAMLVPAGANSPPSWLTGAPQHGLPTGVVHPIMFVVSWALHAAWTSVGVEPSLVAGYSMGEYTAAAAAGVFSPEEALDMVAARARLADGVEPGAMTAIALPADQVTGLCGPSVSIAALNGKAVTVVAGTLGAIQALERRLDAMDAVYRRLDARRAFHTSALASIAPGVAQLVAAVRCAPPRIPFFSNVTGALHDEASACAPSYWAEHLVSPVQWAAALEQIAVDPSVAVLQVGPGAELARLAKAASSGARGRVAATSLPEEGGNGYRHWLGEVGKLWTAGVEVRLDALAQGATSEAISLP